MKWLFPDQKTEKSNVPLVDNDQLAATAPSADCEAQNPDNVHFLVLRAKAHRVATTTILYVLLIALLVVCIGIFAGTYFYRQYLRAHIFKGSLTVPCNPMPQSDMFINNNIDDDFMDDIFRSYNNELGDQKMRRFFRSLFTEDVELDLQGEDYEKIDVPDFQNGTKGRFIHDFNMNKTGIVDMTARRCFVMPLNREYVLPPRSIFDLINKMQEGYYNVDTERVQKTMRIVTPALTDLTEVGKYISRECSGYSTYKLEKYVGGVVKRSANLENEVKYAQFSGKGILEIDIVNLGDVKLFEEHNSK